MCSFQDECGGWTNEKHNLYLDSLENSFVKQLYSLLGVGGETQRLTRTRGVQSNSHKLTDQVRFFFLNTVSSFFFCNSIVKTYDILFFFVVYGTTKWLPAES